MALLHRQPSIKRTYRQRNIRKAYTEWKDTLNADIAITLMPKEDWYAEEAIKVFGLLWQKIDKRLYGNRRQRFGYSIERHLNLEYAAPFTTDGMPQLNYKEQLGRWHLHGTVCLPEDRDLTHHQLFELIEWCWKKCPNSGSAHYVKLYHQRGWNDYTDKQVDETGDVFLTGSSHRNQPRR